MWPGFERKDRDRARSESERALEAGSRETGWLAREKLVREEDEVWAWAGARGWGGSRQEGRVSMTSWLWGLRKGWEVRKTPKFLACMGRIFLKKEEGGKKNPCFVHTLMVNVAFWLWLFKSKWKQRHVLGLDWDLSYFTVNFGLKGDVFGKMRMLLLPSAI